MAKATLYKTSENARRIVLIAVIGVAVLLAFDTFGKVRENQAVQSTIQVSSYLIPDKALGNLNKLTIPALSTNTSIKPTYSLEGVYGIFPDAAYVYKTQKPREKLLVFENAQNGIKSLGFNENTYIEKGNSVYEWKMASDTKTITFDKINQVWDLNTLYDSNVEAKKKKVLKSNKLDYESAMDKMISTLGFNKYGLGNPSITVEFAKLENGIFLKKEDPLEADYVLANASRVLRLADLKPKDQRPAVKAGGFEPKAIEGKVYATDPRYGQVNIVGSNNLTNFAVDLYEMDFTNFEYLSAKGIYSIIKPDEAWTLIQQGGGSLVSLIPQGYNYFSEYPKNSGIKKFIADRFQTQLGYWEPEEWSEFIYPIYVFEGRAEMEDGKLANFTYYIDAIKR